MELAQVIIAALTVTLFAEWNHLRKNKVRHDETPYLYAGLVMLVVFVVTFFI